MKKYPSYKNSGVEWIGEIPSHWDVSKLKYDTLRPVKYGMNISGDKYIDEGIRFIRITDLTEQGKLIKDNGKYLSEEEVPDEFLLDKYDLLLCRSGTVGKSYLYLEDGKYTSGGYLVRFNFEDYNKSKFIFYITNSDFYWFWVKFNAVTSTIENVNGEKYSNMFYPKPPLEEQTQIVEYLDEKTQKIDDLVEKTEKKIELLKEKRTSLINHFVTKGLNPNVEMKDSGVEWIGDIPSHWDVSKFKYISEIVTGNTPSKTKQELYYTDSNDGFLWVKPTSLNVGLGYVNESEEHLTVEGKKQTRCIPKDSTMICCIGNTIGKHSLSGQELSTNQQINSVIPDFDKLNPWFCLFYVNVLTRDLIKWSNFVTLPIFTKSDLEETPFIFPPINEQNDIVSKLIENNKKIDSAIEKEAKRIELLKEYRGSLISEVATGKIDVRGLN